MGLRWEAGSSHSQSERGPVRLYGTKRWKRVRARHLNLHPYCQCPEHKGQRIPAQVVDHIRPHRGDTRLFWDERNLQSLTTRCHNSYKARMEAAVRLGIGHDERGFPLDPDHPWNQE